MIDLSQKVSIPLFVCDWFDQTVASFVKRNFLPSKTTKATASPFQVKDLNFFGKGVIELSEFFQTPRHEFLTRYFAHPKTRSSYLLYFLPLQLSKFFALFELHAEQGIWSWFPDKDPSRTVRILDLGSGPGTATFAFLAFLRDRRDAGLDPAEWPNLEFTWVDLEPSVLKDGVRLLKETLEVWEIPAHKVSVNWIAKDWKVWIGGEKKTFDWIWLGHVLNETQGTYLPSQIEALKELAGVGGVLAIEPADRNSSRKLIQLRNLFLGDDEEGKYSVVGPCLHSGACPLADDKDWCHFSVPIDIGAKWFRELSKKISTPREWVKLTYIWIQGTIGEPTPKIVDPETRYQRILSDPIRMPNNKRKVLLCAPERKQEVFISPTADLRRGALYHERADQESRVEFRRPPKEGADVVPQKEFRERDSSLGSGNLKLVRRKGPGRSKP